MEIKIDVPISETESRSAEYYRRAFVAVLYQSGDLSSKEACDVLGISRREFEELLPQFRVPILPDDDPTIDVELNA